MKTLVHAVSTGPYTGTPHHWQNEWLNEWLAEWMNGWMHFDGPKVTQFKITSNKFLIYHHHHRHHRHRRRRHHHSVLYKVKVKCVPVSSNLRRLLIVIMCFVFQSVLINLANSLLEKSEMVLRVKDVCGINSSFFVQLLTGLCQETIPGQCSFFCDFLHLLTYLLGLVAIFVMFACVLFLCKVLCDWNSKLRVSWKTK